MVTAPAVSDMGPHHGIVGQRQFASRFHRAFVQGLVRPGLVELTVQSLP